MGDHFGRSNSQRRVSREPTVKHGFCNFFLAMKIAMTHLQLIAVNIINILPWCLCYPETYKSYFVDTLDLQPLGPYITVTRLRDPQVAR